MTNEEFDKLCEELLAQGFSEEDILAVILQMYNEGKIDVEEMEKLAGARGYELSPEFKKEAGLSEEETSEDGEEKVEAEDGKEFSKEEIEDAQEFEPGEKEPEAEDEEEVEEKSETEDSEDAEGDEEAEKKETLKTFGL